MIHKEDVVSEEFKREWADQIDASWQSISKDDLRKEARLLMDKEGEIVYKYLERDNAFRLHQSFAMTRIAVDNALEQIGPVNKVILDIGCGPYPEISFKSSKNNRVVCADLSHGYLKAARKISVIEKYDNVEFIRNDVEELPFKDNSIDIIIISEVMEHILNGKGVVNELFRVLRDDGLVILTTPNRVSLIRLVQQLKDRLRHIHKTERDYFLTESHIMEYSFPQFRRLIDNKFEIKKVNPVVYNRENSRLIRLINFLIKLPFLGYFSYSICAILQKNNLPRKK